MIDDAWKSADYQAEHFLWSVKDRVATVTLNRPERKNLLTFESYAELRDLFRRLAYAEDCRAIVVAGVPTPDPALLTAAGFRWVFLAAAVTMLVALAAVIRLEETPLQTEHV